MAFTQSFIFPTLASVQVRLTSQCLGRWLYASLVGPARGSGDWCQALLLAVMEVMVGLLGKCASHDPVHPFQNCCLLIFPLS